MKAIVEALAELAILAIGLTLLVLFWENNLLASVLVLLVYLLIRFLWPKKHDDIYFITGGIIGPVVEIICIHFGIWSYTNPSGLGIPLWLPLAWGLATVMITRIAGTILQQKTENKKE